MGAIITRSRFNCKLFFYGDIEAIPGFDQREYAAPSGCFPVVLKGTGQVRILAVSRLPAAQYRAMVEHAESPSRVKEDI